ANRHVERRVRFEQPAHHLQPALGPVEVSSAALAVLIDVVLVADVERRIGERQVHAVLRQRREDRQAVTAQNIIDGHGPPLQPGEASLSHTGSPEKSGSRGGERLVTWADGGICRNCGSVRLPEQCAGVQRLTQARSASDGARRPRAGAWGLCPRAALVPNSTSLPL